jgi:hypothetical protein
MIHQIPIQQKKMKSRRSLSGLKGVIHKAICWAIFLKEYLLDPKVVL